MPYEEPTYDSVFIVDDDPIINLVHQKIIEKIGITNEIRSFTDPREALTHLNAEVDCPEKSVLVLLDINMPEMSGFEFLESLELGNLPSSVEVIVVTSSISEKDRILAERHPRFLKDFVIKPLKAENLKKVIVYL